MYNYSWTPPPAFVIMVSATAVATTELSSSEQKIVQEAIDTFTQNTPAEHLGDRDCKAYLSYLTDLKNGNNKSIDDSMLRGGVSHLMYTVAYGTPAMARLMLDHGADIGHTNKWGESVLDYAIGGRCEPAMLKLLLERGAVNAAPYRAELAFQRNLMQCAEILPMLLEHGADVHILGNQKSTLLQRAIDCYAEDTNYCPEREKALQSIVTDLFRHGARVSECAPGILKEVVRTGDPVLVALFLKHGANVNPEHAVREDSPLSIAYSYAHTKQRQAYGTIFDMLLKAGAHDAAISTNPYCNNKPLPPHPAEP